jgi:nucleoredoxin
LAGKVVGLYFSAHWCGPCRNFTPKLLELYAAARAANKNFEIVFCSADHDEAGFRSYFSSMKWKAVDFGEDCREVIMSQFSVQGIPKLSILSHTGKLLVDNACGMPLSLGLIDQWIAASN